MRRHWRAFVVAALIGAALMGIQAVVFAAPGFHPLAAVGIGALGGFSVILFALGSEGLLFGDPELRDGYQPKTDPGPVPRSLVKPPPPDATAGGPIGHLPGGATDYAGTD